VAKCGERRVMVGGRQGSLLDSIDGECHLVGIRYTTANYLIDVSP
jgi:hypothetical protein